MTISEALARAYVLLQECSITMKDAAKASEALNLIAASIQALRTAANEKEETK